MTATTTGRAAREPLRLSKRTIVFAVGIAILAVQIVVSTRPNGWKFPESWNWHLARPVNDFQGWVRDNQLSHPLFTWFFTPISKSLKWVLTGLTNNLVGLPWFTMPVAAGALLVWRGRVKSAVAVGLAACYPGFVGLWPQTMQTMALIIVSVVVSLLLGIPLGIWSALFPPVNRVLRPLLDAMQTVPSTVYLIPATLFFGIGPVPAAVATVIFALPPAVRLTALGITQVPVATVEAGEMFGSTRRQVLTKVQLPQALPSIAAGVNQTIMMALGIVVIAALVGAGGLGQEVLETLQIRAAGRGIVVGLAIVCVAIVLDRVSGAFVVQRRQARPLNKHVVWGVAATIVLAVVVGRVAGWNTFPVSWKSSFADSFDSALRWVRDNGRPITRPVNDFIVRDVLIRSRNFLSLTLGWPVLIAAAALAGYAVKGWRLGVGIILGLLAVGFTGMWALSIETLVQVVFATIISALIALPLGVFIGRRPRAEAVIAPVLDALQTIPSLIYTIPFVMIFTISVVPGGIIASSLYAIPAGIRLCALGIKGVPEAPIEAAASFGASRRQVLRGVQLPLALPAIVLALNQVIMMVLSMVVIAGMTGSGALGFEAVRALTRSNTGLGVEVGLAIVVMATILDRLTQALATPRR
jgi:glycine betaine/proline transport system permease protein